LKNYYEAGKMKVLKPDRVVFLFLFFFGLLIYNGHINSNDHTKNSPVSASVSINDNSGICNPVFRLQIFQKESIADKGHSNELDFNCNPIYENKKTDIIVLSFKIIRQNACSTPLLIYHYHLLSEDTDDPPLLG
jgi:hypothetical protein